MFISNTWDLVVYVLEIKNFNLPIYICKIKGNFSSINDAIPRINNQCQQ